MQSFAGPTGSLARLAGITWGAEDLSSAIGAMSNREEDGSLSPLYHWANSLCLCAAAAAGVPPIDTLHADFRDSAGLAAACRASRRRGFRGRIAIHPDQVAVINEAYTPSAAELAHAQRIVDAFAAQPDAGTLSIDGSMVDKPHLTQALRTLGQRRLNRRHTMDFSVSDDHRAIREGVGAVVRSFDDDYWLARDDDGEFPREFHRAMADAGWLGITMPPQYGGAGLGVTEAVDHAARGGEPRRRDGLGLHGAHQPVRAAPDRRGRHATSRSSAGCRAWSKARTSAASASPNPMPA